MDATRLVLDCSADEPEAQMLPLDDTIPTAPLRLPDLTRRQFGRGLRDDGIISFEECVAFLGPRTIPPPLQAILDEIEDETTQEDAVIDVVGAQDFEFTNPLVEFVRAALEASDPQWTPAHLRGRWQAWSAL